MIITWLLFFLEMIALPLALGDQQVLPDLAYIVLIAVDCFVLFFELCKREKKIATYLIIALLMRIFFLFWVEYCSDIFLMPNTGYDEWKFYWNGYAHVVKGTVFDGYAGVVSILFDIFGTSKLFGSFVNLLLSMQAILFFEKTLDTLEYSPSTKNKTMLLLCLLPNYALSSSILLRESIMIFFASYSLVFFARWWMDNKQKDLAIALLLTLPAVYFHSGMIAVTAGYACIAITLRREGTEKHLNIFSIQSITLLCIAAVVGMFFLSQTDTQIGNVSSVSDVVWASDVRIDGNSGYDANVFSNDSTAGFVANTPIHMLYFLLSPLPWQWRGVGDILAFFMSSAIYGWILYKAIKEKSICNSTTLVKGMILVVLFFMLIFGWGTANAGTALRHRDKAIMFYMIMFAGLLESKLKNTLRQDSKNDV